ncbi:MAG: coproporphyrinogen III oxidase family protein, partial [candidate division Zixibacteria bacterium]|nr:coproporphyrinogen III oxidase family protein [candidate division Zixibacteria bacterium]
MNIGVYVHLPFCKSRCSYCDFYSQTDLSQEDDCLAAINRELAYLGERYGRLWTETLYLGGGTPS